MSAHCSVSSCVLARHISRTRTVAQVMSLSSHPHVHVHVSVAPRLALPFYFTHFLPHSFHFLLHLKFVDNLRTPPKESMDLSDEFLLSTLYEQDFAVPISLRASKVLGPISRYRVADILPHMKLVSRASRPGLTVGVLRILCTGLCTALTFHTEEHDHTCRVGCPNEPDSLSH